jgi:hypothetical protein
VLAVPVAYAVLFVLGFLAWRRAVLAAMILAVFEGAIRKWVLPDFGQAVYLAKDMLLVGAYAGFWAPRVLRRRRLLDPHPANVALVLLGVIALLELLNPLLPNLSVGLFGLKAYLVYVPLMYMVPAVFPDAQVLRRFWTWYLLLALIPMTLGLIQFTEPAGSILNRYAWEDELRPGVATFGASSQVRITGTFSYITGYTTYLLLIILMGLALVAFQPKRKLSKAAYGILGVAVVNLLMTGSRGPVLIIGATVPMLLVLAFRRTGTERVRAVGALCVAVSLSAIIAVKAFPEASSAFVARVETSTDLVDRVVGIVREPVLAGVSAGVAGYGVGVTHQARAFLTEGWAGGMSPPDAEGEWERIILEVGPVGFVLILLMRVFVSWQLWTALRAAGTTPLVPYLAAALLFSLASIPGNLVFNHTASLFYWFLAGFGLIRRREQSAAVPRTVARPLRALQWPARSAASDGPATGVGRGLGHRGW